MAVTRSQRAAVRSVRDRCLRAQQTYSARLREALEALHAAVDERDAEALELTQAIESELAHLRYGSAIVEK
jgi:hypothetical protein